MIARVDAAVQKRFDACVHAFMRATGASKRSVRRNAWGLALFACSGIAMFGTSPIDWSDALMMCVYGFTLWHDDKLDEMAERTPGMRSVADTGERYRKIVGGGLLVIDLPLLYLQWRWAGVFSALLQCVWLFQGYLCATSPEAPQKKREHAPSARTAEAL